jgi:hypothetical protein
MDSNQMRMEESIQSFAKGRPLVGPRLRPEKKAGAQSNFDFPFLEKRKGGKRPLRLFCPCIFVGIKTV